MAVKDLLDLTLSGADAAGVAQYEKALHELQCFIGDPVASGIVRGDVEQLNHACNTYCIGKPAAVVTRP